MRHINKRRINKQRARAMGPLDRVLLVQPLPDSLLQEVRDKWPEGRMSRRKVATYIRHNYTNYDGVRYMLARHRYDELRRVTDRKVRAALNAWLAKRPNITLV